VTLGITWFGALASLTPYRSYFLGLALVALGWAHVTTYRARWKQLRRSGVRAYRPTAHEAALWATTIVVFLLALFPYYNPFFRTRRWQWFGETSWQDSLASWPRPVRIE